MKHKKKLSYLQVRIKDFEETMRRLGPKRAKGYRKPGSQTK